MIAPIAVVYCCFYRKFLFASKPKISSRDLLIMFPLLSTKVVFLNKLKLGCCCFVLKYGDNKDQQTGLRVKDTQRAAESNYNSIFDRSNYTNDKEQNSRFFFLCTFLILDNGKNFSSSRKFNCE